MKITDAFWEVRNLGVSTQEVEIDEKDRMEEIEAAMNQVNAGYQVVKVCTGRLDVNEWLSEHGFHFAEASIKFSHDLKEFACSSLISRICKDVKLVQMTVSEKETMTEQIHKGMFRSDRISLDSAFSPEQSAKRYLCWIEDELKEESKLYTYSYKGQPIGFCLLKEYGQDNYYSVLGGVYNAGIRMPLGSVLIYKQLEELKEWGAKGIYTCVSTNNSQIIRVHVQYGYVLTNISYVFVKHMNQ